MLRESAEVATTTTSIKWKAVDFHFRGSLSAAFLGTSTLIPVIASLISGALYIGLVPPLTRLIVILGGALLTLIIWGVMAALYYPYTKVESADANSYNSLSNRLTRMVTWADYLSKPSGEFPRTGIVNEKISLNEMNSYIDEAKENLERAGFLWISNLGYVNVSRLLHRAEEALIMVEPEDAVIADGSRVEVAIVNSAIGNKDYYLNTLERALDFLSPGRHQQFQDLAQSMGMERIKSASPEESKKPQLLVAQVLMIRMKRLFHRAFINLSTRISPPVIPYSGPYVVDFMRARARTAIREVSYSLNEFQDDQWEKLVHVRSQLTRMTVLTGLVLYILLLFAIITNISPLLLISATFFFLIGAGVGLFSRLYEQSRIDSSIDNIRLAGVRLMAALLFSGLAAIGGVVVMQKVATSSTSVSFDLSLFNILIAAAFGLTPTLFFSTMQRQVEAVDKSKKRELKEQDS